jgi:RecB family exonuclease
MNYAEQRPRYLSASSLTEYVKCPRSAVLNALGLRSGASDAQARGTALHDALERYLLGLTPTVEDDLGDLARTNGYLPEPGADILVEYGLGEPNRDAARYETTERWTERPVILSGVPFRGIVDLVRLDRGRLEVWDHKTTASWYWSESADSLRQNLQMWAYAEQVAQWLEANGRLPDGPIRLGHIQYRKCKNPKADDVRADAYFDTSRAEVARKWAMIEALAAAFVRDYARAVADVNPNSAHCKAYGGCKHLAYCKRVPIRHRDLEAAGAVNHWVRDF